MADIGFFPLGLVLLPGERMPLHIFEPRYKELINECIASQSEFAIVLLNSRGTREVGTRAEVVEVLERYEDGRLDIVVEGTDRFHLRNIKAERSFLTADIDPFTDSAPLPDHRVYEDCLAEYRRVMEWVGLPVDAPEPDHRGLAFRLAGQFRMGIDVKQELLEMRSETERLARVKELLEASAAPMRAQRIQKKASSNGHVDSMGPLGPA